MARSLLPLHEVRKRASWSDIPASVIVVLVDGYAIAMRGDTKEILFRDTNHAKVIEDAANYVSSNGGGKVFVRASNDYYRITEQIDVPSNVVIEGELGTKLKLADGAMFNAINIEDAENVTIRGLSIDGNKDNVDYNNATMYEALNCIRIKNSRNVVIEGNVLTNPYYFGVRLSDGNVGVKVSGNVIYGFRDQGISVYNSDKVTVEGNIVFNGDAAGYTGGFIGIDVWLSRGVTVTGNVVFGVGPADGFGCGVRCEGSQGVTISNNVLYDNAVDGVSAMYWDQYNPYDISITGNVCVGNQMGVHVEGGYKIDIGDNLAFNNTDKGIYVKDVDVLSIHDNTVHGNAHQNIMIDTCTRCRVEGNYAADSGGNEGIIVLSSTDVHIIGNHAEGNPSNGIDVRSSDKGVIALNLSRNNNWNGIYLEDSTNFMVMLNRCYDDRATKNQDWGVQEYGTSDHNTVVFNDLQGNQNGPITYVGANTTVKHNIGYVTENDGVATIAAGSTSVTVTHGLSKTPTKVFITPLSQPAGLLWVSNITATTFDINMASSSTVAVTVAWKAVAD